MRLLAVERADEHVAADRGEAARRVARAQELYPQLDVRLLPLGSWENRSSGFPTEDSGTAIAALARCV